MFKILKVLVLFTDKLEKKKKGDNYFTYQSQFFTNHPLSQLNLFVRTSNDEDFFIWIRRRPSIKLTKRSGLLIDLLDCFSS